MCKSGHSSTVYNSPKLETTQMTINSRIDVQHSQVRNYYKAVRKNKLQPYAIIWMSLTNIMWNKRSQTEKDDYILYDSICLKFKSK